MGCDIHVHLERKVRTNKHPEGVWQVVNQFSHIPPHAVWAANQDLTNPKATGLAFWNVEGRNYDFFADLAGVRGPGPEPRGVPDDAAPLTQAWVDSWDGDGHSHSWNYADTFAELYMKHCLKDEAVARLTERRLSGQSVRPMWADIIDTYISGLPSDPGQPTDWRFVYFFDN